MKDFTDALRLAVKAGYDRYRGDKRTIINNKHVVLLDPEFWKTIGRALGHRTTSKGKILAHAYLERLFSGKEQQFWAEILNQERPGDAP